MALNPLLSLIGRLVARSGRKRGNRQTDRQTDRQNDKTTTVTLAAHARRGLIIELYFLIITERLNTRHRNPATCFHLALYVHVCMYMNVCQSRFRMQ